MRWRGHKRQQRRRFAENATGSPPPLIGADSVSYDPPACREGMHWRVGDPVARKSAESPGNKKATLFTCRVQRFSTLQSSPEVLYRLTEKSPAEQCIMA